MKNRTEEEKKGGGRRSHKMVQCTSPSLCTVNRRRYLVTLLQRLP